MSECDTSMAMINSATAIIGTLVSCPYDPCADSKSVCSIYTDPVSATYSPLRALMFVGSKNEPVLRGIPGSRKSLTTAETTALDSQLIILGQSKLPEEREFYLRLAVQEKWTKRELERQVKAALFE